jgi:flavin-dependent dehydrogenase
MSERWKVVIVGGGFGGLSAAQHLNSNLVDVTLIDRRNYHLFQPLLYQVATGSLSAGEVASSLRSVLSRQKNARVRLIAWLVWAFIHLAYLVNFQSRVLSSLFNGAIQDLTFSRGARLITGAAPTDFNFTKELSELRAAREIKPEPVNVAH